jgi:hypothetical protein
MTNRQIARVFLRLFAGTIALGSIACADSPNRPSAAPAASPAAQWTFTRDAAAPATLALCLGGSGDASCFSGARVHTASGTSAPITSSPVFNNNQPVLNSGPTVTLFWTTPAIGFPIGYVIEASSSPGGPANLANFSTGSTSTTLVVPGVPAGTYYVRIRALDASGASAPSNEVQVVVGGVAGGSCPSAPRGLNVISQSGGTVTLGWLPPLTGAPTSYVIQAGSSPNGSNLANFDTNSTALTLVASNVPAGSYFVRVYGRSSGCDAPAFLSASSNEILLTVGAAATGWGGQIVCNLAISGPSGYRHNETQTWTISGPGVVFATNRTSYPIQWSALGSGGGALGSWTIDRTATTDLTLTLVAGVPTFDRTTEAILIRGGLQGTPTSYDLFEMKFPPIVANSASATSISGTWSRPNAGGDAPVQPGGSTGTLSCTWSLTFR